MGAAFLLLETKSVVQFALLFGTTWFVNSLVFVGVLLSVLLAIEVERRIRIARPRLLLGLLFVGLFIAWLIPTGALLGLPVVPRLLAAIGLAFFPIFVANLTSRNDSATRRTPRPHSGANLLGAMVGGTLEYVSLLDRIPNPVVRGCGVVRPGVPPRRGRLAGPVTRSWGRQAAAVGA